MGKDCRRQLFRKFPGVPVLLTVLLMRNSLFVRSFQNPNFVVNKYFNVRQQRLLSSSHLEVQGGMSLEEKGGGKGGGKGGDGGKPSSKDLVIVLAGPTATGKSDVAARICAINRGIIVSADSVQAYRGVQIGANKPTEKEREETPHILIDVADCTENYNAADWRDDAIHTIQTLLLNRMGQDVGRGLVDVIESPRKKEIEESVQAARRQKGYEENEKLLPVVCGGTMMYIQWLVHGRPDALRPTDAAVRQSESTISEYQTKGDWLGAVRYVSSFGPIFENRCKQFCGEDWYRLRRTLEVALTLLHKHEEDADTTHDKASGSNGSDSDDHRLVEKLYTGQRQGSLQSLGYDVRCFFLCPNDRMSHTSIIDERCERMILAGLIKETAELSLSGRLPDMAARAIGYRQTLDYLQNSAAECNEEEAFDSFLHDFTTATRRYSKKQMSWFRKDKDFAFIPVNMTLNKSDRIEEATSRIVDLCKLSREDFDDKVFRNDSESTKTKQQNAEQARGMKLYQPARYMLKPGSDQYRKALEEATAFRSKIQATRRRTEEDAPQAN